MKPSKTALHYTSRQTVTTSNEETFHVQRDEDGSYSIHHPGSDTTIYTGEAETTHSLCMAIEALLEANDEV